MNGWYDHVNSPAFKRTLWVIGPSTVGKSTFALSVAAMEGVPLLEAGFWARSMCSPNATVAELTSMSLAVLRSDERYFSKLIGAELAKQERSVLAGSRNPIDFIDNFNVLRDAVVFLGLSTVTARSAFEETGTATIASYVRFLLCGGLIEPGAVVVAEPRRNAIHQV